jgi:hypothetical protein
LAGYTPLFDSVLDGTLFGKWPHTGIWTCLLSQVDQHGEVDMNPALLAAKIGVPVDLLLSCIRDFMQPDPGSRTKEHDGRRLELIDPDVRDWGWRVINHSKYREKARKKTQQQTATESGKDAERKRLERQEKEDVQRCPAESGAVRPSEQRISEHLNAEAEATQEAPPVRGNVTPAGEMAIALRDIGVAVRSTDPVLHRWLRDGFTVEQARDAVGLARIRKPTGAIPANYLDPILRQPIKPPQSAIDRVTWRPPPD